MERGEGRKGARVEEYKREERKKGVMRGKRRRGRMEIAEKTKQEGAEDSAKRSLRDVRAHP